MYGITDLEFVKLIEGGIPLEQLEKRLRPNLGLSDWKKENEAHDNYKGFSGEGFIGLNESLLELVHKDWQTLEKHGVTHQQIADALEHAIAGKRTINSDYELKDPFMMSLGPQSCPWGCEYGGQDNAFIIKKGFGEELEEGLILLGYHKSIDALEKYFEEVVPNLGENHEMVLRNRRQIKLLKEIKENPVCVRSTHLLPHLIKEHYFFEGKETPYRADPELLMKMLNLGQ